MAAQRLWTPSAMSLAPGVPVPPAHVLARWLPRVQATFVDGIVVFAIYLALAFPLHLVRFTQEQSAHGGSGPSLHDPWLIPLILAIYGVSLACRPGAHNGQTLGKQALGLRVVRNDRRPVTLTDALLREGLCKALPSLIADVFLLGGIILLFPFLDDLWPLRDGQNRALHDFLVKTHVIETAAEPTFFAPSTQTQVAESVSGSGLPPLASGAGSMTLADVPVGRTVYVPPGEISRDASGNAWISPSAHVRPAPDQTYVVRVTSAPEGLFARVPRLYEPYLAEAGEAAEPHGGERRAVVISVSDAPGSAIFRKPRSVRLWVVLAGAWVVAMLTWVLFAKVFQATTNPAKNQEVNEADSAIRSKTLEAATATVLYRRQHGSYEGLTLASLQSSNPLLKQLPAMTLSVSASADHVTITAKSAAVGEVYTVTDWSNGNQVRTCKPSNHAGCSADGTWTSPLLSP